MSGKRTIWVGYDPRPAEVQSFVVARHSIKRRLSQSVPIFGVILSELRERGLYTRPTEVINGKLWDTISNAPMSTEFAISRFLVPYLAKEGWALFVDADVMALTNVNELFAQADPSKACMVVKHHHEPKHVRKMDGQLQTSYARKNWSSVVLWNCDHEKTRTLTPAIINGVRGLWLHQFSWLDDEDIGELDPKWNWLVGHSDPAIAPALVHFTEGVPSMAGYEACDFSAEWWNELRQWAQR